MTPRRWSPTPVSFPACRFRWTARSRLVTGASKGIGRAIAGSLADAGAKVMLSSRKQDQLEIAAAEIGGDTAVFAANAGDVDCRQGVCRGDDRTFRRSRHPRQQRRHQPVLRTDAGGRRRSVRQDVPGQPARSAVLVPGRVGAGDARQARRDHQHRLGRWPARRGSARRVQPHQGGADPPDPPTCRRTRPDPGGRHRPGLGEDRLRFGAGRQLRRPPRRSRCRLGGSANRKTSPIWPRSWRPIWRRGSRARRT